MRGEATGGALPFYRRGPAHGGRGAGRRGWGRFRGVRGAAGVPWVRAGGVARARRGGLLRARSAVLWAAPATSGTGVGGPDGRYPASKGLGGRRRSKGRRGREGGTRCRAASATPRRCHGDPLADRDAQDQGLGRQQRPSTVPIESTTPRCAMQSRRLW